MVRVVEQSKLSLIVIIYLQILTILAESNNNNKQIQSSFDLSNTRNQRTLNSKSAQEGKLNNQQSKESQKHANLKLENRSIDSPNIEESMSLDTDINGELKNRSTFILEELVDRFMEKNSDTVRRNGGAINSEQTTASNNGDSYNLDDYATQQVNNQSNDSFIDGLLHSTRSPYMQSIDTQLNEESKINDLFSAASQHESSDLDTDRHIQYDVIEPEKTVQPRPKLHPRHAINELSVLKLANYTTINDDSQSQTKNSSQAQTKHSSNEQSSKHRQQQQQQQQQLLDNLSQKETGYLKNVSQEQLKTPSPEQNQIFILTNDDTSGKNEHQLVASTMINPSSSSASRIVQARSMSNNLGASISKTPQHTRPPYATYDQFHHRGDANSNKLISAEQPATPSMPASLPATGTDQVIALSGLNSIGDKANGGIVQDAATLVHSISRISSQLASDTARRESGKQQQQQVDKDQHVEDSNNINIKQQQQQQQLHKLASSVNQLVELNPIPMNDQAMPSSDDQIKFKRDGQQESVDRFYFSKENQLFNYPSHSLSTRSQPSMTDKYNNNADQDSSFNIFNVNEISSNNHQLAKIASQYPGHENSKLNSMLDSRLGHEQFNKLLLNNERAKETQIMESNNLDKNHYAASLINVTAPMILPLSATEAMESSLGDQVGAKNLIHQVSGFLRSPSSPSSSLSQSSSSPSNSEVVKTAASTTKLNQPPRSNQYYVSPLQATSPDLRLPMHQSIYSQPANQFSPKPNTNNEANSISSGSATNNDTYLEERMRLNRNGYILAGRKPPVGGFSASQLASTHVNHANSNGSIHQASGFRSPLSHPSSMTSTTASSQGSSGTSSTPIWPSTRLPTLSNYLSGSLNPQMAAAIAAAASERTPTTTNNMISSTGSIATPSSIFADNRIGSSSTLAAIISDSSNNINSTSRPPQQSSASSQQFPVTATTSSMNGMVNVVGVNNSIAGSMNSTGTITGGGGEIPSPSSESSGLTRPIFNLTRVEHISAECSNDLIRTVIIFNGTFKGIIYSSGYVRDPNCVYINGTGKTRYQFNIRLNQCGTLGRQELHPPVGPNEIRRRDQVMWNTLSIQYNPIIEQEWDEHFRVSCEYGSDFWKTVSFNPFNVETNTGSPVVFTVDPPQCQMEILRGHGMVGPRQEAVSGPVTVGDPLTLLIHMKSEKAGYDILVKNCIAHNGGHQKMQLIDNNGCVVNERFISPFRGTYNDNDMKHVTLYSYLKAFRFTGSPVLYLECEIHMCQSSCPPQMCYWRKLSKRSASNETTIKAHDYPMLGSQVSAQDTYEGGFLNEEFSTDNTDTAVINDQGIRLNDNQDEESIQSGNQTRKGNFKAAGKRNISGRGQLRRLDFGQDEDGSIGDGANVAIATSNAGGSLDKRQYETGGLSKRGSKSVTTVKPLSLSAGGQISDKVSLFQALEVRQERHPDDPLFSSSYSTSGSSSGYTSSFPSNHITTLDDSNSNGAFESMSALTSSSSLMCYRRAEILAFLFTTISVILVAISISVGFCWRAANLRKIQRSQDKAIAGISGGLSSANLISRMSSINNLLCKNQTNTTSASLSDTSSMKSCSINPVSPKRDPHQPHHSLHNPHHHHHHHHNHQCTIDSSLMAHPNQLRLSPILQPHSSRHK